jgi:type I restriction enzyme S subunit
MEHKRLPADIEPDHRYQVQDGDILLTRGSGSPDHVGVAALAKTEERQLLLSDLLYRIRLGRDWSPDFVTLALRSQPVRGLMGLLFRGQSGQTIKLRAEDIRSIDIPAVPPTFQSQIVAELSAELTTIRSAGQNIEASLSLLAERRQALITVAVSGGIAV